MCVRKCNVAFSAHTSYLSLSLSLQPVVTFRLRPSARPLGFILQPDARHGTHSKQLLLELCLHRRRRRLLLIGGILDVVHAIELARKEKKGKIADIDMLSCHPKELFLVGGGWRLIEIGALITWRLLTPYGDKLNCIHGVSDADDLSLGALWI